MGKDGGGICFFLLLFYSTLGSSDMLAEPLRLYALLFVALWQHKRRRCIIFLAQSYAGSQSEDNGGSQSVVPNRWFPIRGQWYHRTQVHPAAQVDDDALCGLLWLATSELASSSRSCSMKHTLGCVHPRRTHPHLQTEIQILNPTPMAIARTCHRMLLRGRLKRSARAVQRAVRAQVQLFGRLAVLETHTLRY